MPLYYSAYIVYPRFRTRTPVNKLPSEHQAEDETQPVTPPSHTPASLHRKDSPHHDLYACLAHSETTYVKPTLCFLVADSHMV